ncbi:MAG TPA: hypothetical protein DIU37_03970, partial [Opitutae bacterium]|nr:hypothetical protein [Opitutae bacterium]
KSSADKILSLYKPHGKDCSIEHYHLDLPIYAPLWHRAALIDALQQLAGAKRGILIITGLKKSILGPSHRWNARAQKKYAEAITYSEAIAAQFSPTNESLHLLFL